MRAMTMGFNEAAEAIGKGIVNIGPKKSFENRKFHYPGLGRDVIEYTPGVPSLLCRWDGIAEDRQTEREDIRVPSAMRYELRILHRTYGPQGTEDDYVFAQQRVLEGTGIFFEAIAEDRTMGNLIMDLGVEASFVGLLRDEITMDELWGHQINLIARLFYS